MSFVHPEMVWLVIPLVAVPLILHLWNRRRHREEPWAAMTFLLRAHRRSRRRILLEHWLLMAARMIVLVLLVLVIARPHSAISSAAASIGEARQDCVIVLDDSLSMAARCGEETAFDRARAAAVEIIDGLETGDRVAIVTAAGGGRAQTQLVLDHGAAIRVVSGLPVTSRAADLREAVQYADALLTESELAEGAGIVYVLTDLSEGSFPTEQSGFGPGRRTGDSGGEAASPGGATPSSLNTIVFVNVGPRERGNLAVRELRCRSQMLGVGIPASYEAVVVNYGDRRTPPTPLELRVDGAAVGRTLVPALNPGASHVHEYEVQFSAGGSHHLSAQLGETQADVLRADDARYATASVNETVSVLAVEGRQDAAFENRELFFLGAALGVRGGEAARSGTRIDTIAPDAMTSVVLARYDLIVLANVRRLSGSAWKRLAAFVRGGGGLWWLLGDRVSADHYNRHGISDPPQNSLLPFRLTAVAAPKSANARLGYEIADRNHAVMFDLLGHSHGGLGSARVNAYWGVDSTTARPTVRTLLRLTNGEPAIVVHSCGAGRVVTWLTGAGAGWTNLAAKPDFVPLVLNLTAYAVGDDRKSTQVSVGTPLVARCDAAASRLPAQMRRPDGSVMSLESTLLDASPAYVHRDSGAAGIYALGLADGVRHFAVNVPATEGKLGVVGAGKVRQWFGSRARIVNPDELNRTDRITTPPREYASALMVMLFAMVVGEAAMATVFGHRR